MNCDGLQIIHCCHQSNPSRYFFFDARSLFDGDIRGCRLTSAAVPLSLELSGTRKGD